jgi:starch synthase
VKILFAASEAVPFCKTGGLADVAGALPAELAVAGHECLLVLPLYRAIDRKIHKLKKTNHRLSIPLKTTRHPAEIWAGPSKKNFKTYFIGADAFFDRPGLYGPVPGSDHPDNDARYALFCRAVLEAAQVLKFKPDVVHTHDWQTGLVSPLLKAVYRSDSFFRQTASFFSIHNMAYQGLFDKRSLAFTGLPASEFSPSGIEFYGKVNYLKGGLAYADALSTVSPTYAKEIRSSYEFGYGLEGLLQHRSDRLRGILNGIDTKVWNPQTDPHLETKFTAATLAKRARCKLDLQKQAGLKQDAEIPLLGFVGRLDRQKGITFLLEIAPQLLKQSVQLVVLGVGDRKLQESLLALSRAHRSQVSVETNFAEPLAHKIYGGADLFLMPSLYEPCGLGQMIAMRYGALPVVMPTGGLLDTVIPFHLKSRGTGFVAASITGASYLKSIQQALGEFRWKPTWTQTQKRVMKIDFSWKASLPSYLEHYEKARLWQKKSI